MDRHGNLFSLFQVKQVRASFGTGLDFLTILSSRVHRFERLVVLKMFSR